MLCDNTIAIQFTKDSKFYQKNKHNERHYHFVRNTIKIKELVVKYISTKKMIADSLPKPIPKDTFKAHALTLGLCRVYFLDESCYVIDTFFM